MMSWHYRVRKRIVGDEIEFDIVGYFPKANLDASCVSSAWWSENGLTPTGSSRSELIECLENMLKGAKRYKSFTEK